MLRAKFNELIRALPDFERKYSNVEPVRDVQLSPTGTFAFVEFASEELCATALLFDKVIIGARRINCGRPQGSTEPATGPTKPMDVSVLIERGLLPSEEQKSSDSSATSATSAAKAARRQRELYVGNLPHGTVVTEELLLELFTPASKMLPQYDASLGEPVLNVSLNREHRFAFVEMQSDHLAGVTKIVFDKMEFLGHAINVRRPAGYVYPPGEEPTSTSESEERLSTK